MNTILSGKRVLVTGAGGSIGRAICREVLRQRPAGMLLVDRDDSALHDLDLQLAKDQNHCPTGLFLADICHREALDRIFRGVQVDVVYHAAALKHVPLLETNPQEAFRVNVVGTRTVLEAAHAAAVDTFVNISTDKAANPVTVLGRSKRMAERLTAHFGRGTGRRYLSVRFGNVLWSRGSVLPVFTQQIADCGPVTVTHPEATRYLMTSEEAARLMLLATAVGEGGETLIPDMGQPVKIVDLARQLIEQSDRPIEVSFIGLRPGEKLHEDLFDRSEVVTRLGQTSLYKVEVRALAPDDLQDGPDAELLGVRTG